MKFLGVLFLSFFFGVMLAQPNKKVDFLTLHAQVTPNFETKSITGNCTFTFDVKQPVDTIKIDAKNMDFYSLSLNEKSVHFQNNKKQLVLYEGFAIGRNVLKFTYEATPKQALYFVGNNENFQIWTQGQGKYTSHWLPSFDDVNEKLIFSTDVVCRTDYTALSNGVLQSKTLNSKGSHYTWSYAMTKPMSSYLVMLAIGKYDKKEGISKNKIPLEWYIEPIDSSKFETTYCYSQKMFDYLNKKIGVKYPWQVYRQVPVRDFVYAGMENTTATIFAREYVVDNMGYNDQNYINVNAHELAHQWFGDLITATEGKHHWLQEGFATYYALMAEKNIFGEDHYFSSLYNNWLKIRTASSRDTIPILNEKASSLSFYQKGAWALHALKEDIGERKFDKAVKKYLKKYAFQNVKTDDFLNEIKKVAPRYDVLSFQKKWLENGKFDSIYNPYLKKWKQYKYLEMVRASSTWQNNQKDSLYIALLQDKNIHAVVKQAILSKFINTNFTEKEKFLRAAFTDKNILVQKAIVRAISNYPLDFQPIIDSLFENSSYDIKKDMLNNIIMSDEQKKQKLATSEIYSHKDSMLRVTWLRLALQLHYKPEQTLEFNKELNELTSANHDIYTRLSAFWSLNLLAPENKEALANLFLATQHYNWQLNGDVRQLVRSYFQNEAQRNIVLEFQKTASPDVQDIIQKYYENWLSKSKK